MSRIHHLPLSLFLLLCTLLLALAAPAHAQKQSDMVSVDRNLVRLRAGAGTNHEALWEVTRGYPLQVLQRQGNWLQVQDFEKDTAWVYRPLVASNKPHVIVTGKTVNLRSAPSTRSAVVGKASYGDVLRKLGQRGDWVRVQAAQGRAWISRTLVWGQ